MDERLPAFGALVPILRRAALPNVLALALDGAKRIVLRLDGEHQKNVLSSSTASQ